ncbi:coniferyl-aldehyde dehydrogenase [Palleronia marisminoris]|uniref:Aldehyde dehydrogenase n=1 Tax=Palleronia marisminoris TaxID=315423 RepID=A0A1Y5S769_9RHOB|nr:aldehyde dehydrogenase family protein [Palleronia marisminoris]SFG66150.1 coniferyl-aldehyde dehydrogenase [Palleronia marisminoris]SLN33934.1 Coniferyl aldehyde dehydrogenase [Palleronia marisminoris]
MNDALEAAAHALRVEPGVPDVAARRVHLDALADAVRDGAEALVEAIDADFGHRPRQETLLTEIAMVLEAVRYSRKHLKGWCRPRRVILPPHLWPALGRIRREPLGLVGILAPWNYPVQLALVPLVAALAGGNRVLLHPSEHTPRTSEALKRLVEAAVPGRVRVVTGGTEIAQAMCAMPLDGLFFTGSTETGRRVMESAARNLVPVTLELGGKSPAIVRADADLAEAAESIVAGKLLNAGQTCIAPDYALVPRALMTPFEDALRHAADKLYPDPEGADYATIARETDLARLGGLLEGVEARPLMTRMPAPPRMGLWSVIDPPPDHPVMEQEIFGPVLPLVPYDGEDAARAYVAARPVPLALYVYGRDTGAALRDVDALRSGGAMVNEAVQHVGVQSLPFGGAGASGMGAYHGDEGFRSFTRPRSVIVARRSLARMVRPPYGRNIDRILRHLLR